ncbi:fumarate hydratase [uncultured Methanomethylovorans sp.]|uniref:fumarate hydratase n=1 Tax=uncultured Methanomethylovorans sp. TaxID=183759 RepID=UPI0009D1FCC7|nr:fumarate hydratase [uncultured Methanomethylovorans sp.]OPY17721.1 MAG: fumarate hydratase [Methanomethylovorans sp. PtaU1.Bin073]
MTGRINYEDVVLATVNIIGEAEICLPQDVIAAIENAYEREKSETARAQFAAILKNIELSKKGSVPMCQDTGIMVFFVEIGRSLILDFDLEGAIVEGVRRATVQVPLRPNAVSPLSRQNSGDNTGSGLPDINYSFVEGNKLSITVAPKGAGSENMSALRMFNPTEISRIREFVLETVLKAGGMPCPPIVVGVGIGGSFDKAARLAKQALLMDMDKMDPFELELLKDINALGIGPMGMGGCTTALAVHVKQAYCHTASLPVAVNIQCWANRHAKVVLEG